MTSFACTLMLIACLPGAAAAQDAPIAGLRSTALPMRGWENDPRGSDVRGATPQLTRLKHQLRDWVESRLVQLPLKRLREEGPDTFATRLNADLEKSGLTCEPYQGSKPCPEWFYLGFLEKLRIRAESGFLIVVTGAGIECGFDESAYIYSWSGDVWTRVWQSEQDVYVKGKYLPQDLQAVLVSPFNRENDYLVMTLGSQSWCSSNLRQAYYRIYRLGPELQAQPLVEEVADAFEPETIQGTLGRSDALIEFTKIGADTSIYNAVRHYRIEHDKVTRIDPLALSPRDFVEEWMTREWKDAREWSESEHRRSSLEWHMRLARNHGPSQFFYPTMHCPKSPDLWQVGFDFRDPPAAFNQPAQGTYFLVRWRPPYRFSLVEVSDHAFAGCTEKDRQADDEKRTLFPSRRW